MEAEVTLSFTSIGLLVQKSEVGEIQSWLFRHDNVAIDAVQLNEQVLHKIAAVLDSTAFKTDTVD